jgi:2'-5' RNA ligase
VSRVQARIELPPLLRDAIEPYRQRWNPERAAGNPAHVTVIYHDEAPFSELLRLRLAAAARTLGSFELVVREPRQFTPPVLGVFLEVADPSAAIARLREQVLVAPFVPRTRYASHVTLLHPEQGQRVREAWPQLSRVSAPGSMRVSEIVLVGSSNEVVERIPLATS